MERDGRRFIKPDEETLEARLAIVLVLAVVVVSVGENASTHAMLQKVCRHKVSNAKHESNVCQNETTACLLAGFAELSVIFLMEDISDGGVDLGVVIVELRIIYIIVLTVLWTFDKR